MYIISRDGFYVTGYTRKGIAFLFDIDDFNMIKQHTWHLSKRGYISTKINRKNVTLHKILLGVIKGCDIDHISGNKLDNRRSNLRICTHQENCFNQKKKNTNTTGFTGVCKKKNINKYEAYIHHNGKKYYLGLYNSAVEAAIVSDKAAVQKFGEFLNLNFIDSYEAKSYV